MEQVYRHNGLIFWSETEIKLRNFFIEYFALQVKLGLKYINKAWEMQQIEAPILTPTNLLNQNYTSEDIYVVDDRLALRPETTPGSYAMAMWLNPKPPFVIWQAGKSFRREQDQVTKNMRLKEFYQQEFQCVYSDSTKADYQELITPTVQQMIESMVHRPTRVVESDRLPDYSKKTMDVEIYVNSDWMEVASISKRTDYLIGFEVLEIAIGLDRCVYCASIPRLPLEI